VYNFFRNLRATIGEFEPIKCFAALEGHPQFRYDLYAGYKANRIIKMASPNEAHERFNKNQPIVLDLLKHLPITLIKAANYEADDTVATLAENLKDEDVTIISGDTDYIQLLQKGFKSLKVYSPIKKEYMKAPDCHFLAWKALTGDKSDNIPRLVGEKAAQKLLTNPDRFKKWLSTEENRANFNINMQLIEFRKVPDDDLLIEDGQTNFDILKSEFTRMEFNSIVNDRAWKKFCKTFDCLEY